MKIVIAPDSFKESLSAVQVAEAIAAGWRRVYPDADLCLCPMADGGEGTVDAVVAAAGGQCRTYEVQGPLGGQVQAQWGWLDGERAVIETAAASGLNLIAKAERDVCRASTYGTGQLVRAALDAGATQIILGLGGSATNDGGAGLLTALGARLTNAGGDPLPPGGAALAGLHRIDLSGLDPRLAEVGLLVASDVNNPLCGPTGASHIFGPQKGAGPDQVEQLDRSLGHFADVLALTLGHDLRDAPGAGAAGGLGFAALAVLHAGFRPGVEMVAELSGLAQMVKGAALVITGEGRLDGQSLHGKTPVGVARIASVAGVPTIALGGSLGEDYKELYAAGIMAAFSLVPGPLTLAEAMRQAPSLLADRAEDLARFWQLARGRT